MVRLCFFILIISTLFSCNKETEGSQYQELLLNQWNNELKRLEGEVSKLGNDLEKTTFLRDYCSQIADYGPMTKTSNSYFNQQNWDSNSMVDVYHIFKKDSLPASCAPISEFYCQLLNHFDFKCATYGHGIDLESSHVLALVEINFNNQKKIIIQDPYYALNYIDKKGVPIDFSTLIQHIQSGEYHHIFLNKKTIGTKIIIKKEIIPNIEKVLSDSCLQVFSKMKENSESSEDIIVKAERTYNTLIDNACNSIKNSIEKKLISKEFPANINHILLLKRHIGGEDKLYFEQKINHILKSN